VGLSLKKETAYPTHTLQYELVKLSSVDLGWYS